MRVGIYMHSTDRGVAPDVLAREVEERGFQTLMVSEHTHVPVPSPDDDYTSEHGANIPERLKRTLDPFVALSAAAAATKSIRLATGVCLVAQHDPIVLAKSVASLDWLSGGRFDFGIGFGSIPGELEHHGVRWRQRRVIAAEYVAAMRVLWRDEVASFQGDFVKFGPSWSWPKPIQTGGPPILLGAELGPRTLETIVAWADGWAAPSFDDLENKIARLQRAAKCAGRKPVSIHLTSRHFVPQSAADLRRLEAMGVDVVYLRLPDVKEEVHPVLTQYTTLLEQLGATESKMG